MPEVCMYVCMYVCDHFFGNYNVEAFADPQMKASKLSLIPCIPQPFCVHLKVWINNESKE